MEFRDLKKRARKNIKNNYFKSLLVVFFSSILIVGGINFSTKNILKVDITSDKYVEILNKYDNKTNSEIIDELLQKTVEEKRYKQYIEHKFTEGVLSAVINEVVSSKSLVFSLLNGLNKILGGNISIAVIIFISNALLFLFRTFFLSVLEIGRNRYFLEQRRYLKTNIDRCLLPYKERKTLKLATTLLIKNIYLLLWSVTIVGVFIKYYEYAMIPYVLAENPSISRKDAFKLSKQLMDGNKLNMFKLDLSIMGWKILGLCTFNLLNIFYTNIYEQTLHTEFFTDIRKEKYAQLDNSILLNDNKLYIEDMVDGPYFEKLKRESILNIDINKKYTLNTYILFFFTFCFVGWLWEVFLHIVEDGAFVNRGTMYGPWLPIYGCGGVLILFLLKKFRNNHLHMFIASFILCGVVEYSTAWFLETFRHLKYWDYTGYFLNLHGRICLEGLFVFGLAGCGFTYIFAPLLDNLYSKINLSVKRVLCIILIVLFSIDLFYSTFIRPNSGEGITSEVSS